MAIDVDKLLAAVSADKPEGEDLEYAPEYLELETLAKGKPEEEIGGVFKPAEEPEWREVRNRAQELSERTRDVRVATLLALGLLKMDGLAGFAQGAAVIHGIVEQFWDSCYPKLDPDDNNDPTMRLNALAPLGPTDSYGDTFKFRLRLMEAPLVESRRLGRFTLKDILTANGKLPFQPTAENANPPDMVVIKAAMAESDLEALQAVVTAAGTAMEHLRGLDKVVLEKAGAGRGPNLRDLTEALKEIQHALGEHLAERTGAPSPDGAAADGSGAEAGAAGGVAGGAPISGEIRSRDDAVRMMDKICEYFARAEPSSPVPLLIKRARRLTRLGFMDLIRDLSPDALDRIVLISGPEEGENAASDG